MQKIFDKITEIENNEAELLTTFNVDNFWIWSSMRIILGSRMLTSQNTSLKPRNKYLLRLKNIFKILYNLKEILKFRLMPRADVLIFSTKDFRRDYVEGFYRDVYFSHLYEFLSENDIPYAVADLGFDDFGKKLRIKESRQLFYKLALRFFFKLFNRKLADKNSIPENLIVAAKYLEEKYQLPIVNVLFDAVQNFRFKKKFYACILKKYKPKLVFLVPSVHKESLIFLCKERGIPVIEGNHGVLMPTVYLFPQKLRELAEQKKLISQAPDYFLGFGSDVRDKLVQSSLIPEDNIRVIGNPRIDYFLKRFKNISKKSEKIEVLIISQFTVTDELIEFVKNVNKYLVDNGIKNIFIRIKLHWDEFHRMDEWQACESEFCEILSKTSEKSKHLYEMILESDFVASVYSTVISEAVSLETPTIVIKKSGWESFADYVENKVVLAVETPTNFIDNILEYSQNQSKSMELKQTMHGFSEKICRKDGIKNYLNFFAELYS